VKLITKSHASVYLPGRRNCGFVERSVSALFLPVKAVDPFILVDGIGCVVLKRKDRKNQRTRMMLGAKNQTKQQEEQFIRILLSEQKWTNQKCSYCDTKEQAAARFQKRPLL
jgi:hypothetical protein